MLLGIHPRSLTARPWKMIVGSRSFPLVAFRPIFRGRLLLNFQGVMLQFSLFGYWTKNSGKTSQIIYFNRVFHYFHHPFWGTMIGGLKFHCNKMGELKFHDSILSRPFQLFHPFREFEGNDPNKKTREKVGLVSGIHPWKLTFWIKKLMVCRCFSFSRRYFQVPC